MPRAIYIHLANIYQLSGSHNIRHSNDSFKQDHNQLTIGSFQHRRVGIGKLNIALVQVNNSYYSSTGSIQLQETIQD